MSGAPLSDDLAGALEKAGFEQIVIEPKPQSAKYIKDWLPGSGAEDYVVSANISAVKPLTAPRGRPTVAKVAGAAAAPAGPDTRDAEEAMPARMRNAVRQPPKQAVDC